MKIKGTPTTGKCVRKSSLADREWSLHQNKPTEKGVKSNAKKLIRFPNRINDCRFIILLLESSTGKQTIFSPILQVHTMYSHLGIQLSALQLGDQTSNSYRECELSGFFKNKFIFFMVVSQPKLNSVKRCMFYSFTKNVKNVIFIELLWG